MTGLSPVLRPYVPVAEMLARALGPDSEAVLHDLRDPQHSVVYVAGHVTGRQVGQSFDHLIRQVMLSDSLAHDFVANYYFHTPDGRRIRSSTVLIRDSAGELAGALCLNLDTTEVTRQLAFLQKMLPPEPETPPDREELPLSQMVAQLMDRILGDCRPEALSREERVEKLRFMDARGVFLMKGSVELAAQRLGVNKVTVYSYLDEARGKR